jgi:hypothetical protein
MKTKNMNLLCGLALFVEVFYFALLSILISACSNQQKELTTPIVVYDFMSESK